jgi:restriction system protein
MGYVKDQVAEESQRVEGVIIALEDDQRLKRALSLVPSVTFFRYEVNFSLKPVATNA